MVYDIAVIGTGVVGSLIARELSKYELKVCALEKEADVAMGTSRANSAIIHAGYDPVPGSLKAKLNVKGNEMMDTLSSELGIPFKRIGSLVLAFDDTDSLKVKELYERGCRNGLNNLQLLSASQVRSMEPNISEKVTGALYALSAGITCPYEMTLAAMENAVENGVTLLLETTVKGISSLEGMFSLSTSRGIIRARMVVNAAGLYSDEISAMIGDDSFQIKPRKGEYLILDKSQGGIINSVIFQTPSEKGKGILVTPTVDGNLLIGPNSVEVSDKNDTSTSTDGLSQVMKGALKSVPFINTREFISSFSGLRASTAHDDFIIKASSKNPNFINVAGIDSPGLTAAPAIAEFVVELIKNSHMKLKAKSSFNSIRTQIKRFHEMSNEELLEAIQTNPKYGNIICRCEMVSEAEIIDSISRPCGASTLDGIKRRTRAGMGRCQGGFCTPRVVEILSRELGIPYEFVTKSGGNSRLLACKTKQAKG